MNDLIAQFKADLLEGRTNVVNVASIEALVHTIPSFERALEMIQHEPDIVVKFLAVKYIDGYIRRGICKMKPKYEVCIEIYNFIRTYVDGANVTYPEVRMIGGFILADLSRLLAFMYTRLFTAGEITSDPPFLELCPLICAQESVNDDYNNSVFTRCVEACLRQPIITPQIVDTVNELFGGDVQRRFAGVVDIAKIIAYIHYADADALEAAFEMLHNLLRSNNDHDFTHNVHDILFDHAGLAHTVLGSADLCVWMCRLFALSRDVDGDDQFVRSGTQSTFQLYLEAGLRLIVEFRSYDDVAVVLRYAPAQLHDELAAAFLHRTMFSTLAPPPLSVGDDLVGGNIYVTTVDPRLRLDSIWSLVYIVDIIGYDPNHQEFISGFLSKWRKQNMGALTDAALAKVTACFNGARCGMEMYDDAVDDAVADMISTAVIVYGVNGDDLITYVVYMIAVALYRSMASPLPVDTYAACSAIDDFDAHQRAVVREKFTALVGMRGPPRSENERVVTDLFTKKLFMTANADAIVRAAYCAMYDAHITTDDRIIIELCASLDITGVAALKTEQGNLLAILEAYVCAGGANVNGSTVQLNDATVAIVDGLFKILIAMIVAPRSVFTDTQIIAQVIPLLKVVTRTEESIVHILDRMYISYGRDKIILTHLYCIAIDALDRLGQVTPASLNTIRRRADHIRKTLDPIYNKRLNRLIK